MKDQKRFFDEDLDDLLEIDPTELSLKYKSLEGTRHIIQYEHKDYVFTLSKTFKPKIECFGVTNRCEDGKFILFLDFDKIYKTLVYKNIENLVKAFPKSFGNFYIAKTEPEQFLQQGGIKGSYHVINFAKQYKCQIEEYLKYCDVDPYFLKIPEKTAHKCHVLRISQKTWKVNGQPLKERPEYLESYPPKLIKTRNPSSKAHYKLFQKEWKITDPYYTLHNFDDSTKIELHKYSTPKVV